MMSMYEQICEGRDKIYLTQDRSCYLTQARSCYLTQDLATLHKILDEILPSGSYTLVRSCFMVCGGLHDVYSCADNTLV